MPNLDRVVLIPTENITVTFNVLQNFWKDLLALLSVLSLFKVYGGKIMKYSFPKNQKIGKIEQCFLLTVWRITFSENIKAFNAWW